jgi:hypothetical protein
VHVILRFSSSLDCGLRLCSMKRQQQEENQPPLTVISRVNMPLHRDARLIVIGAVSPPSRTRATVLASALRPVSTLIDSRPRPAPPVSAPSADTGRARDRGKARSTQYM